MSANNDAGRERKRLCLGDDAAYFVYTNLEDYVPDGVVHVRVHPSIKVIPPRAFYRRRGLTTAILNNGLEEIGERAFWGCVLVCINIPPSVRAIKNYAFFKCLQLATVIFNDGLEVIWERAFFKCRSLREILFPPSVRAIKDFAFYGCSGLATAILNDGLEEIGECAFYGCVLVHIHIPPSLRAIDNTAFNGCSNLTTVQFCDEIEEFVSAESMRHWWNNGVHEKCLSTYCFFVQCNIPMRVGLVRSATLQTSIHGMLERIPSKIFQQCLNAHFDSINSKLSAYEAKLSAYEGSMMLELAIWKSKIAEQTDGNINLLTPDMRTGCRNDSLWMVDIILPNVLSFLRGDAVEGDNGDDDDGDGE